MSSPRKLSAGLFLAASALIGAGCASSGAKVVALPEVPRGDDPSLVVLIVVDQLRGDYLERFRPVLDGGLGWLLDNGAVYSDAHQNHAMTATAPGHATISTGVEPSRSGIIGNEWFNRETGLSEYSAGVSNSPANLEVTAIGDWFKAADLRSKVFTVSGKDRSAVMMGGQRPDAAYWYDKSDGVWTSSRYYTRAIEPWLEIALDSAVARGLKTHGQRGELPRWPGLKSLIKSDSDRFQGFALGYAAEKGITRVHLDMYLWLENRKRPKAKRPKPTARKTS